MKNFQQNLLIVLALGLCGLCIYYWRDQTNQRTQIEKLNTVLYGKMVEIQGYTNSIKSLDQQITQMDRVISELRETAKTNEQTILSQKRELNRLETEAETLTNEISQYKQAVATLEGKLKDAYAGIQKQNDAMKELAAQRDDFVKKYNDSVNDRNDVVAKYNDLVKRLEKTEGGGAKPTDK
jgi:chromosome segregation ATPase